MCDKTKQSQRSDEGYVETSINTNSLSSRLHNIKSVGTFSVSPQSATTELYVHYRHSHIQFWSFRMRRLCDRIFLGFVCMEILKANMSTSFAHFYRVSDIRKKETEKKSKTLVRMWKMVEQTQTSRKRSRSVDPFSSCLFSSIRSARSRARARTHWNACAPAEEFFSSSSLVRHCRRRLRLETSFLHFRSPLTHIVDDRLMCGYHMPSTHFVVIKTNNLWFLFDSFAFSPFGAKWRKPTVRPIIRTLPNRNFASEIPNK